MDWFPLILTLVSLKQLVIFVDREPVLTPRTLQAEVRAIQVLLPRLY